MVNIQVIDKDRMLPPSICVGCGAGTSSPREYFADMGLQFDFWGALYICDACLDDVVKVCRSAVPLRRLIDAEEEIQHLRKLGKENQKVIEALKALGIEPEALIRLGDVNGRNNAVAANGSSTDERVSKAAELPFDEPEHRSPIRIPDLQLD